MTVRGLILLTISFLVQFGCKGQMIYRADRPDTTTATVLTKADSLVLFAQKYIGVPYRSGGSNPDGFDCSGYVNFVFRNNGITVPRSSPELAKIGVEVPLSECRKGDIILFTGSSPTKRPIGHAGIVISDPGQPVRFIHSATSNRQGIVITALDQYEYYLKRFVKVVRVVLAPEEEKAKPGAK